MKLFEVITLQISFDLSSPTPVYLSLKEIWRQKSRFLLISFVVALITILVLFIAGLTEGLAAGNREFLEKVEAELIVFQANTNLSFQASRLDWSKLREIRRVEGVKEYGPIGLSSASIADEGQDEPLKVNLIGIEPGKPGEPPVKAGSGLGGRQAKEVIIDTNIAAQTGLGPDSTLIIKSLVGADEELYDLRVVGISNSQQYFVQPSVIVPIQTWDDIKPRAAEEAEKTELVFNVVGVKLDDPADWPAMAARLEAQVKDIEAVDRQTAYEAAPGYRQQQDTLNTQRLFTLLIGALVIGGFFQIQTLQKIAQVGMLKAIGASNKTIVITTIVQIVLINIFGVIIGGVGTYVLTQNFPSNIPISFENSVVFSALVSLLLIGPISGLISVRTLLKVEPLTALGLGA